MFHHLNDICMKYGLTGKQFLLLRFFYLNQDSKNEHILQTHIQDIFHIRRSTVTSILQTLEKKEMIVRKTDESDQRKKVVFLTEQAKDIIQRIELDNQQNDNLILSVLDNNEYSTLIGLLDRICDSLIQNSK